MLERGKAINNDEGSGVSSQWLVYSKSSLGSRVLPKKLASNLWARVESSSSSFLEPS